MNSRKKLTIKITVFSVCSTHVVFIRKKSDIDTPYITCEVNNCGNIIQYLTRFNRYVEDDNAMAFKIAYQEFLHEHF